MENIKIIITLAQQSNFDELDVVALLHSNGLVVEKTERVASQQKRSPDVGKQWHCPKCGFLNRPVLKNCSLCKTPRG